MCENLLRTARSAAFVLGARLVPCSTSEDLYIYWDGFSKPNWNDDLGNRRWFELLRLFSTVKNLYSTTLVGSDRSMAIV
jgi:hypothetical protein